LIDIVQWLPQMCGRVLYVTIVVMQIRILTVIITISDVSRSSKHADTQAFLFRPFTIRIGTVRWQRILGR